MAHHTKAFAAVYAQRLPSACMSRCAAPLPLLMLHQSAFAPSYRQVLPSVCWVKTKRPFGDFSELPAGSLAPFGRLSVRVCADTTTPKRTITKNAAAKRRQQVVMLVTFDIVAKILAVMFSPHL